MNQWRGAGVRVGKFCRVACAGVFALALVGCTDSGASQPEPSAPVSEARPTPAPSCDPGTDPCTPEKAAEQAETKRLQEQAEQAYRATFTEFVQLSNQGGADEPSPQLKRYAHGDYLTMMMELLQNQKKNGVVVKGNASTDVRSSPATGDEREGEDPRLTMAVCEDNSQSTWSDSKGEYKSNSSKGRVFAAVVDGEVKVVSADLDQVESCDGW